MLAKLNIQYTMQEVRDWIKFRKDYLKAQKQLSCCYCGKANLQIKSKSREKLATLDHKVPLSKGGSKYDPGNLVVSCVTCNNAKDNMPYDTFMKDRHYLRIKPRIRKLAKAFRKIIKEEDRAIYPLTFLVT